MKSRAKNNGVATDEKNSGCALNLAYNVQIVPAQLLATQANHKTKWLSNSDQTKTMPQTIPIWSNSRVTIG